MTTRDPVVVIHRVSDASWVDRVSEVDGIDVRFARTADDLRAALSGADVLFGFDWNGTILPQVFEAASDLKWIQWAGAGVDALLFPELIASDVVVTNAGGIYDDAIAEHVLAFVFAHAKGLHVAVRDQQVARWKHRLTRSVSGTKAAVVGAGGIGRAIARALVRSGVDVQIYGTTTRHDDEFGPIRVWDERSLNDVDWLVGAAPLTPSTRNMFNTNVLRELPQHSIFVNIGRGASVDEDALTAAIEQGQIAGAALDVFAVEPLPAESPLWAMPNVLITPHHSGDDGGFPERIVDLFLENLASYRAGKPLKNLIDKSKGYRSSST